MANSTVSDLIGNCVAPFLDAAKFPSEGGFITGRFCAPITSLPHSPTCCLPCPATEWTYSESFQTFLNVSEWLNVVGLALLAFMLLSYSVLPAQQTRSHYLSVCLILSITMIAIGFTIPLGVQPEQCYNEITPNNMYSSMTCAWSGAFIIAGGLTTVLWVFMRALSMNLQICWDIVPGKKFFYASQLVGWGIPAILFTITITLTGVSFRFGSACHVNHNDSMGDFWGPLLAFAGAAGILQLVTFGYCIRVYLKNLWSVQARASSDGSGLPSYTGSVRTQTARAVYQRLKKVLWLQWRGIVIVTIILVDVIFFSIVFVSLDSIQQDVSKDWTKIMPWLTCLAGHPTHKDFCLPLVQGWLVNESTVVAVLVLLGLAGLQVFLLLTRPSVFPAWWDLLTGKSKQRQEFVSLEARPDVARTSSSHGLLKYQHGTQATTFEMQSNKPEVATMMDVEGKGFEPASVVSSPEEAYRSPLHEGRESPTTETSFGGMSPPIASRGQLPPEYIGRITPSPALGNGTSSPDASLSRDYFSHSDTRRYQAPNASFSGLRPPSRGNSIKSVTFDPRDVYRGGLALNPPSEAGESTEELNRAYQRDERHRR